MEPTRTNRRRYVAFRVSSPRLLPRREVVDLLKSILGEDAPNATLLTYNPQTMEGILRCDHKNIEDVRRRLNSHETCVRITTLKTSGTLKALRRKLPETFSTRGR